MSAPQPGTPLPWSADNSVQPWWGGEQVGCMVRKWDGGRGNPLANCLVQYAGHIGAAANAAYIVHAANNFPKAQALADALVKIAGCNQRPGHVSYLTKTEVAAIAERALTDWEGK
jgi:hypothetical protein